MNRLHIMALAASVATFACTDNKGPDDEPETVRAPAPIAPDLGPEYDTFPSAFQPVAFRGRPSGLAIEGNTRESITAAESAGVKHVEVDFVRTRDGFVVSGHDDKLGGDCGIASRQTLDALTRCTLKDGDHIITLDDVLRRPFDSVYVDFKSSDTDDDAKLLREVTAVTDAIDRVGATDRAVVMLYRTSGPVRELLTSRNVRFGLKGYPKSKEETQEMVARAAEVGAELICVRVTQIDAVVIRAAAERGVWLLGWGTREDFPAWRQLAAAGMGGLISRLEAEVGRDVASKWVDVRTSL